MVSAGIELAYMLFTPGPDEAVEPLILGLASAALLTASKDSLGVPDAAVIGIACLAMALLFYVRKKYIPSEPPPAEATDPQ
jgi:hypothetical protein